MSTFLRLAAVSVGTGRTVLSAIAGVCVAQLDGVMTTDHYVATLTKILEVVREHDCTAFVCDYTKAAVAMDQKDFVTARKRLGEAALGLRIPGAVVAPEPCIQMVKQHVWNVARFHGIERAAFTCSASALAWAQKRAREVRALRLLSQAQGFAPSMPGGL